MRKVTIETIIDPTHILMFLILFSDKAEDKKIEG